MEEMIEHDLRIASIELKLLQDNWDRLKFWQRIIVLEKVRDLLNIVKKAVDIVDIDIKKLNDLSEVYRDLEYKNNKHKPFLYGMIPGTGIKPGLDYRKCYYHMLGMSEEELKDLARYLSIHYTGYVPTFKEIKEAAKGVDVVFYLWQNYMTEKYKK
jgi:hypothetical protein